MKKTMARISVILFLLSCMMQAAQGSDDAKASPPVATLSADQVVAQLMEHNNMRTAALKGFAGKRVYKLEYKGFPVSKSAELEVEVKYTAPATKEFTILSQKGSGLLVDKVLKKLLESEKEASSGQSRANSALTTDNYRFTLDHTEQQNERTCYVLNVLPLREDKYLYRGKVWVDDADFAVVRIEGEPAKNPSFWIKKTAITHEYRKVGDFWLPAENKSVSNTRFGGHATLEIHYVDYQLSPSTPTH